MRDSQMILSEAQAETTVASHPSTNVYDNGSAQDNGVGEPLRLVCNVNTLVTSGGAATVQVLLEKSVDNVTFTTHVASEVFALADLVAGKKLLNLALPALAERYMRVSYVIGTAVLTAGAFDAWFEKDSYNNTAHASGFTV